MPDYGKLLGAAGDLFGAFGKFEAGQDTRPEELRAEGYDVAAKGYRRAAYYAEMNQQWAGISAEGQRTALHRKVYQTLSGQQSDVASSGLRDSGSALELIRDSAMQAGRSEQMLDLQSEITQQGYTAQKEAYENQAEQADLAAQATRLEAERKKKASTMGGIGDVLGAAFKIGMAFL